MLAILPKWFGLRFFLQQAIRYVDPDIIESLFAGEEGLVEDPLRAIFAPPSRIDSNINFIFLDFDNTAIGIEKLLLVPVIVLGLKLSHLKPSAED